MRNYIKITLSFLALIGLASCSEDTLDTYTAEDNIYFALADKFYSTSTTAQIDSTGFNFAFAPESEKQRTYKIPMRVQGAVVDYDRTVKVSVDPSSTAILGTDFTLPEKIVFGAGKTIDSLEVTVLRTSKLLDNTVTIVLNLEENEFFATNLKRKVINKVTNESLSFIQFKLSFYEFAVKPKNWNNTYYANYSPKKYALMCEQLHLSPTYLDDIEPTSAEALFYNTFMYRYLQDQKDLGNIILEEDGTPMVFPPR